MTLPLLKIHQPDTPLPTRKVKTRNFDRHHYEVLLTLAKNPRGLTDEEIHLKSNLKATNVRGRRNELVGFGYAKDSGTVRVNSNKRKATVWILTPQGVAKSVQISLKKGK